MKKYLMILNLLFLLLVSCGDSDLSEDYLTVSNKILAIRIQEPEASPGETVSMKLLVSGKNMDQLSDIPVTWTIGSEEDDYYYQGEAPYHQELQVEIPSNIPVGETFIDVPVLASIILDNKLLSSLKRFRITNNPAGMNPQISEIQADWKSGNDFHTRTIAAGETITIDHSVGNIAFTVNTLELPQGANDQLVYKWYFTTSKNSDGLLEVNDDLERIEEILGSGSHAAEFRQSVLISLYGEDGKGSFQKGTYNIYIVIRDNASESNDRSEDRLGTDFSYFTLEVID